MNILILYHGEYGRRHIANIQEHGPKDWQIHTWKAPSILPLVIDEPEEFLPPELPDADLILSFGENKSAAELIPELARRTGAQAVIASIDSEAWLPRGLAQQLTSWLQEIGVACATPKPLCSLIEADYALSRRERISYHSPLITEFARYFGQPSLQITCDPDTRRITEVAVLRDAVCGCARYAAQGLVGAAVEEAAEKGGLLHHHYPCLASMGIDRDYGDTLMHISGNILKDHIQAQVKPFIDVAYITPDKLASPPVSTKDQNRDGQDKTGDGQDERGI